MSRELIGILGVGVALLTMLGGLMLHLSNRTHSRIDALSDSLDALSTAHYELAREFSEFRGEMRARLEMQPVCND